MPRQYGNKSHVQQLEFQFGPLVNSELFSNHWLQNRMPLEPEWEERRVQAGQALDKIAALFQHESDRLERYQNESQLEHGFIQPVLEALGWKVLYRPPLKGLTPDFALFANEAKFDKALEAGQDASGFWSLPDALVEAKAWHRRLDKPVRDSGKRYYPPQQIENYLFHSGTDYGILTNGKEWRLVPRLLRKDQPRFHTYLSFMLPQFLADYQIMDLNSRLEAFQAFFRFYLLFSPAGFVERDGRIPIVQRAAQGSSEYRLGVGEDLRPRVFEALRLAIQGFLDWPGNKLDPGKDLERCRQDSFILLYRLLFIMYAEDRGLLPYGRNRTYTLNRSLARTRQDIATNLDGSDLPLHDDYKRDCDNLWQELLSLFDLVDAGNKRYGVPPYNGGLFRLDSHPFLRDNCMSDWYLARVIDQLGRAEDQDHPGSGPYRVDYRDLQIQHLGNIYEGLLELRPHVAQEPMAVIRGTTKKNRLTERTVPASEPAPRGFEKTGIVYQSGSIYLATDKGERRASGSYYTPDHIVDHIVERTLGPICRGISDRLTQQVEATEKVANAARGDAAERHSARLTKLLTEFDDRILRLRVLDPAMGSGHFLLRACQYLAEEIVTNPYTGDPDYDESQSEESALTFWKRRVVERCLYGVDLNPLAVELAKLALWLETVSTTEPLSFLDHHLRHGNSLVGADFSRMGALPGSGDLFEDVFGPEAQRRAPVFLKHFDAIEDAPSHTPEQLKDKGRSFQRFLNAREPFVRIADLWCANYFLPTDHSINEHQYNEAVLELARQRKSRELAEKPWFRAALDRAAQPDALFFHWELEFPEVFFTHSGPAPNPGFDAIIGNPPYDVLSEKETGHNIDGLKAFIADQKHYQPSCRGKNNLYKLFLCRALHFLREGGRLGQIVPMPLLGDDQAADLRKRLIEQGAFTSVEAFPQKDSAKKRVFPEAKLATAVFTFLRTQHPETRSIPFPARVHPENKIKTDSPSLELATDDIPLYDANNLSIVSCSQDDWDLAVRIMQSGRMRRLGEVAEQFQGEVNETTCRNAGKISYEPNDGPEALRGAHICLYTTRAASQGTAVYVRTKRFTSTEKPDAKCLHHKYPRIGFQRKAPQNNFRRLVASPIPPGIFLVESVSYVPDHRCEIPLDVLLPILNSNLADWFFRLGSTNAVISEYQFKNLPCPIFANSGTPDTAKRLAQVRTALDNRQFEEAFQAIAPVIQQPPFPPESSEFLAECARRIIAIEKQRGEIPRSARSALAPEAQPLQNLIDRVLYHMAGLTEDEARGLEDRLAKML